MNMPRGTRTDNQLTQLIYSWGKLSIMGGTKGEYRKDKMKDEGNPDDPSSTHKESTAHCRSYRIYGPL